MKQILSMRLFKKRAFLLIALFISLPMVAQEGNPFLPPDPFKNWDGISHWTRYLVLSPGYMGPNALPVPQVAKPYADKQASLCIKGEHYWMDGDKTFNAFLSLKMPFDDGRFQLEMFYVPWEVFEMDSSLSYERRAFGQQTRGTARGDFYFGSRIQLLRDRKNLPDLSVGMYCKTASGTQLTAARYSDGPGYYFDLAVGKKIRISNAQNQYLAVYANLGFYAYQMFIDNYPQNDAFLYGAGFELSVRDFRISSSLRGYYGYMNLGDRPLVYRANVRKNYSGFFLGLEYEKGLKDWPYQAVKIATGFYFDSFNQKEK